MRRQLLLFLGIFFLLSAPSLAGKPAQSRLSELRTDFDSPGRTYGTDCWWWWLNGNVDEEAISRDLAEMARKGFYGAVVIDAGGATQGGHTPVPAGPQFGSPEWCRLFRYALDEAAKYGLVIGANIQSGWNLGGPCVSPEYAAKHLVYSTLNVSGAGNCLPPQPPARHGYYRDIAVLAFPATGPKVERIRRIPDQTSDRELGFSTPDGSLLFDDNGKPEGETLLVRKADILDLSGRLKADGTLDWTPPAGEWTVVRVGFTCTSAAVSTCSDTWGGRVLDHLSAEAFDYYWDTVVEPILSACGPHVGTTLRYLSTDSWEAGGMNWTPGFETFFRAFNGYDITPWLVAAAGFVVESREESLCFFADFRKTVGEAIATRHFGRFAERARAHGIGIQPESAGPHGAPFDGIRNYGLSDIVMSEFWAMSPHRPTPIKRFFLKQASSAAHVYGKSIVGAESFTTIGPQWNDCLWRNQKPAFDHEVCEGLNRVYFHTFTCSPASMGRPGQEYFAGTHFNPQITWWEQSGPYLSYLSRIQAVAQRGEAVCEVLYYYGDHVPNIYPLSDPVAPGYDYDVVDERSLLGARVCRGRIVLPSGRAYRLLLLPPTRVLSPAALRQVENLVRKGATVLGEKPLRAMTLRPKDDFQALADRLWGDGSAGVHAYGRGRVVCGVKAAAFLAGDGLASDCEAGPLHWIHYRFKDGEAYFLSNQTGEALVQDVVLRAKGPVTLWNAVDGSMVPADARSEGGRTRLALALGPFESRLVVLGKGGRNTAAKAPEARRTPLRSDTLSRWTVRFDPALGGPGEVVFDGLSDWTLSSDPRIRHYSGPAVYRTTLRGPGTARLSLGEIRDVGIAQVRLGGRDLGTLWTWPFEVDLSLEEGDNLLEITVVNSWYNRLAGDQSDPGKAWGTRTNIRLRNPSSLSSSGLLGPVLVRYY